MLTITTYRADTMAVLDKYIIMKGLKEAAVNPFRDVKVTDWFYTDVMYALKNGLFYGTSADTFSPGTPITRGMFVTVLGRISGIDTGKYTQGSFSDVNRGMYYMPYIEWAKTANIVYGVGNNTFAPDTKISRQDIVTITKRYVDFKGKTLPVIIRDAGHFADEASIAGYAKEAVDVFFKAGIISGKPGNLSLQLYFLRFIHCDIQYCSSLLYLN